MAGRVLVVDDDRGICDLIADMLVEAGFEPVCLHSDRDAYAMITTLPTLTGLVVDVNLGKGTTGFDVARFARQVIPTLPVIYVTGEVTPDSFQAFGVPGSQLVQKPFTPDDLVEKLKIQAGASGSP